MIYTELDSTTVVNLAWFKAFFVTPSVVTWHFINSQTELNPRIKMPLNESGPLD